MGRPAAFDRDDVLERATELFWRQGYLATSVSDLVEATALKPGSLYNAFDSKQGLLLETIDRYGERTLARVRRALDHGPVTEAVERFFAELVEASLADPDAKGCFLINSLLELSAHDELARRRIAGKLAQVEALFREALERGRKQGEFRADSDGAGLAKFLMMSIWGLRVLSRARSPREALEGAVAQVLVALRQARA